MFGEFKHNNIIIFITICFIAVDSKTIINNLKNHFSIKRYTYMYSYTCSYSGYFRHTLRPVAKTVSYLRVRVNSANFDLFEPVIFFSWKKNNVNNPIVIRLSSPKINNDSSAEPFCVKYDCDLIYLKTKINILYNA